MRTLALFLLIYISPNVLASDSIYINSVFNTAIRTVEIRRTDLTLATPVIGLGTADQLVLAFDDLTGQLKNYFYTFIHCNQDWTPSDLNVQEYLDGFEENFVYNYQYSFNTKQKYIHYSIAFPNNDVVFKTSGNYIIAVWDEDDRTKPILTMRFYVTENIVPVTAYLVRPNVVAQRNEYQKLEFTVDLKNLDVDNPYELIRVTVMQNNIDALAMYNLKPRLIQNNLMIYDDINQVFHGMKEYRRFDIRTLKFQTDRIQKIERNLEGTNVFINIDNNRAYQQYFYEKDMNGNFVVMADLTNNPNVEGDYAMVHFSLEYPYWLNNGNFYVVGAFNNYVISEENKMIYDFDKQMYTSKIYMKQGAYNYMYAFLQNEKPTVDFSWAEGNYFETENEYGIYIYLHAYNRNHDRLIAFKSLNYYK